MPGEKVVLKVISPTIIHKTEVGGVKVVEKKAEKVRSAWRRMMYEVPENFAAIIEKNPSHGPRITSYNVCYTKLLRARWSLLH